MRPTIETTGSEIELVAVAVVAGLVCAVVAWWVRARVPAVTVALTTGLATGLVTAWTAPNRGSHGVPLMVLVSASGAMAASGLVSAWLLPRAGTTTSLRRAAVATLVAAPIVGLAGLASIQHACPLYVAKPGACYYAQDVLGGWSAAAAVVLTLDMVIIAVLLLFTDWRNRSAATALQPGQKITIDKRS